MMGAPEKKAVLRKAMQAQLRAMTVQDRDERSLQICVRIIASKGWLRSKRILLFSPMRGEPNISPLHAIGAGEGKQVAALPSSARVEEELDLPFMPDLILVPGLAYSKHGHRLGRGGGFYDRLLAGRAKQALKMGVCFDLQLLEKLPQEQHDASVDIVISG